MIQGLKEMLKKETKSINSEKYENAIQYFIKYCNNEYLGRTKLNKLLYYLDFISYRDRNITVTGDIYIHKTFGPVPQNVDAVLVDLTKTKKILASLVPYKEADKWSFEIKAEPKVSVFDEYEKKLLEYLCATFQAWDTTKIVGQTHLEAPWFYSMPFCPVDFKYASNIGFFSNATVENN